MIRLMRGSLSGTSSRAEDVLRQAAELRVDEVVFYSLFEISKTLDPEELRAAKLLAAELGVGLGSALEWLNPLRPARNAAELALGDGDYVKGISTIIGAAANLNIDEMFFTIGTLDDRKGNWTEQLAAVADTLKALAPVLADCNMRLLVKTHEEITSFEVLRLIETVGSGSLGVSFDPVNMLVRLEDPVDVAARLAPFIRQVHIDDAILQFEGNGIRRYLCRAGDGIVDWDAIFALVPGAKRLIELHSGQFAMPIFDPEFIAEQDYLTLPAFASIVEMATRNLHTSPPIQGDFDARLAAAIRRTLR
ncbi:sugar phosphate isomerase/epimerase [Pararhizobium sp. YC-54]|uniref:sugar phosphate isomerase/epimerase family protein n=1 Tax=Pararhizobium sp. YC-54 TaxID=2986920 RepID=UPI0021F6E0CE|nr:sugar phosphate isomerase/epimerase [Pararhizobium sp. YC-54]MCV9999768.1 sugar phosphate isomerase/epimerase [Pararhizobium sp. YC-54]